jgi:hypothetical protein
MCAFLLVCLMVMLSLHVYCDYNIYVSNSAGNDHWSGSNPYPNVWLNDGPFKSIQRAQKYVRNLRSSLGSFNSPIMINILPGTYRLHEPLVFDHQDSGDRNGPVIYKRYELEPGSVLITSCQQINSKWYAIQRGNDTLLRTAIHDVKKGIIYPHSLFINDQRRNRARSPIRYWVQPVAPNSRIGFIFSGNDLIQYDNLDDAHVIIYHTWTASHHYIKEINTANKSVIFTNPTRMPIGYNENGNRYYIENVLEELDEQGGIC